MGILQARQQFNIIIVGAGVSGLTAALSLHQKGHRVTVFERHDDTLALGGPLNLSPTATQVLIDLGLKDIVQEQLKLEEREIYFRRFADGRNLAMLPTGMTEKMYGSGIWTASRSGWQKILRNVAEEKGINIMFSAPIATVEEPATVILRDGRRMEADLIIGADGIGSLIRRFVIDEVLERRNPVGAINIDIPLDLLKQDPEFSALIGDGQSFWLGPGGVCAAGPVNDINAYNMCWVSEEKLGSRGEWFVKGDLAGVIKKYKDWDPKLLKMMTLANPDDCYVWNITDLPPLSRWSKGRIVIIGDAAHATLPMLGLGATAGVEDGKALTECLDRAKSIDDIPRLLKAFEDLRKPRVESIIDLSREMWAEWSLPDGEQQIQRDALYRNMPTLISSKEPWDGRPVDNPPTSVNDPLFNPYFRGLKLVEYTNRKLDTMGY